MGHLGRDLHGDQLLLRLLRLLRLLQLLLHGGHNWVCRLLDLIPDPYDARLGVDRAKSLLVGSSVPLDEEVGEHVAMVSDEEGVWHVGQFL